MHREMCCLNNTNNAATIIFHHINELLIQYVVAGAFVL